MSYDSFMKELNQYEKDIKKGKRKRLSKDDMDYIKERIREV